MSEVQARELLIAARPSVADQPRKGRELADAWLFTWDTSVRRANLGAMNWLITDDGQCAGVTWRESVFTVLARLRR